MGYDDKIMLVNVHLDEDGIGPKHEHYHSQVSYIVSRAFELTIGEVTKIMKGGDAFYIPPHAMHGAICRKSGILTDVFNAIGEDFIE